MRFLKKMIISSLIIIVLSISNVWPAAGYITRDATVVGVANTYGTGDNFFVKVTGGTGICAEDLITFKGELLNSEVALARAYSTALTAFSTEQKVHIWAAETTCNTATQIHIFK